MRAAAVAVALACGGCIPAVPFVVGETAETLQPREVSAALYGGGGAFTGSGSSSTQCCGGVMGRVRVGIGHAQEVGVEGGAYVEKGDAWGTAKLAWKLQLDEHYALLAGAGVSWIDTTVGIGGDAGVIASTRPLEGTRLQLYSALRLTMMVQDTGDIADGGLVLSGGVLWNLTRRWRLAFEVGAAGGGSTNDVVNRTTDGWFGAYGAALVSYAWRR